MNAHITLVPCPTCGHEVRFQLGIRKLHVICTNPMGCEQRSRSGNNPIEAATNWNAYARAQAAPTQ